MDLGEGIVIALGHSDGHSDDTCVFCSMVKDPTSEENSLTDDYDEDENEVPGLDEDGIAFKNNAGALGTDLENNSYKQPSGEVDIGWSGGKLVVNTAAHHIIPGNAALKKSKIMKYLHKEGMAKGNIGYNVNNFENGVWLCGNYALRGSNGMPRWGSGGMDFVTDTQKDPKEYAFAAIDKMGCQFHDAHKKLSDFVLKDLNLLAKKMDKTKDLWCPEAKNKPDKPEERQLVMLVARLNTISRRLKGMLENPGKSWKTNVFTSRFSEQYIKEVIYKK
jgi:hypothetical protein